MGGCFSPPPPSPFTRLASLAYVQHHLSRPRSTSSTHQATRRAGARAASVERRWATCKLKRRASCVSRMQTAAVQIGSGGDAGERGRAATENSVALSAVALSLFPPPFRTWPAGRAESARIVCEAGERWARRASGRERAKQRRKVGADGRPFACSISSTLSLAQAVPPPNDQCVCVSVESLQMQKSKQPPPLCFLF